MLLKLHLSLKCSYFILPVSMLGMGLGSEQSKEQLTVNPPVSKCLRSLPLSINPP